MILQGIDTTELNDPGEAGTARVSVGILDCIATDDDVVAPGTPGVVDVERSQDVGRHRSGFFELVCMT